MVKALALSELVSNGKVIGYKLKDDQGNIMDVKSEAIKSAIKQNKINIINLTISTDDKLVMVKKEKNNNVKNENKQNNIEAVNENKKTSNSKIDRIHELVAILNKARFAYEQQDEEIMSNFEYDKLYDELKLLEDETGTVLNNSPTQNVGYEVVSKLPKKKHSAPMLSLEKTKDRDELAQFLNGHEGVLSWKLDGLTVVLTYDGGELIEAVTRGNGEIGEVVTNNARTFVNLPKKIAFLGHLVLRGEATITYSDFEKINSTITMEEELYKNPRNLCSGSVRQLDSSITAKRNVHWTCFNVVEADCDLPKTYDKQMDWTQALGFDAVEYEVVNQSNIIQAIEKFSNKVGQHDTPTDGLVLTFRDVAYGKSLGRTAKSPRHSMAFKWKDETEQTTVEYIDWSPSRTGLINPVVVFKPVDIDGSTISRASVSNVSIFANLELGYGDRIEVYKANKIIPQVSENLDRTASCEIPMTCPCCGCETEIHRNEASGVLTLWCPNPECDAKGDRLLEHFVSRDAMNIDGISKATLIKLSEEGIVDDFASIYHIKDHKDEIVSMDGFGVQSFNKMVTSIDKSRNVKLANLIYAVGIPNVGLTTAKLICKNFGNDLKATVCASYNDLIGIEGIGDVIAQSFVDYFADHEKATEFMSLLKELTIEKEEISTDTSMAGVTICVTGDVYIFPNRRAVKDIVENMGGKLTGSVSRSTSYLVTNDTTSGSRKNKAAQQYGIPILTEQEFIDKFNIKI